MTAEIGRSGDNSVGIYCRRLPSEIPILRDPSVSSTEITDPHNHPNKKEEFLRLTPTKPQNRSPLKSDDYRWEGSGGEQICISRGWWPRQEQM